ncbi:general secretion pathway protein K [Shimia isoporae]|uniref:Type II secretion system protein K n=1 Tax=Shimia isoporae TaxID=647720 RepID=A0A4R1N180_9RHOB|nr:type II secretion system minor pseudopilin GspK [Shimia isoporae]TCK99859.1 general secretion pathway protein K [Shimia isoporae]
MNDNRGFVLLNALILVAALSAVAVLLLSRANESFARRLADQDAAQLRLALDGGEAMMRTALLRDVRSIDHANDSWAQEWEAIPVDRGTLSLKPYDLQGRFNVNWLANPEDTFSRAAFDRLLQRLGLPAARGDALAKFLTPGQKQDSFENRTPPITHVGGPVLMLEQLRIMPEWRENELDKLLPFISALPSDSVLNVNTAPPEVLDAMLPGVPLSGWNRLTNERLREPLVSIDDFRTRLGGVGGFEVAGNLEDNRFSVATDWVAVELTATTEPEGRGRRVTRLTVFERRPLPLAPRVAYRLSDRP